MEHRQPAGDFKDNPAAGDRYFWLRRTFEQPSALDGRGLALTLGKISENYQVFLDGTLVGGAGDFTIGHSQLARPRTFRLPPLQGTRHTIAIRVWRFHGGFNSYWQNAADTGPYAVSAIANAPWQERERDRASPMA